MFYSLFFLIGKVPEHGSKVMSLDLTPAGFLTHEEKERRESGRECHRASERSATKREEPLESDSPGDRGWRGRRRETEQEQTVCLLPDPIFLTNWLFERNK